MAVPWTKKQRTAVRTALTKHPLASNYCSDAARDVLVPARERDGSAQIRRLLPQPCRSQYVLPLRGGLGPWFFHDAVHVEEHVVDGFTETPGESVVSYLESHWQFVDDLAWEEP